MRFTLLFIFAAVVLSACRIQSEGPLVDLADAITPIPQSYDVGYKKLPQRSGQDFKYARLFPDDAGYAFYMVGEYEPYIGTLFDIGLKTESSHLYGVQYYDSRLSLRVYYGILVVEEEMIDGEDYYVTTYYQPDPSRETLEKLGLSTSGMPPDWENHRGGIPRGDDAAEDAAEAKKRKPITLTTFDEVRSLLRETAFAGEFEATFVGVVNNEDKSNDHIGPPKPPSPPPLITSPAPELDARPLLRAIYRGKIGDRDLSVYGVYLQVFTETLMESDDRACANAISVPAHVVLVGIGLKNAARIIFGPLFDAAKNTTGTTSALEEGLSAGMETNIAAADASLGGQRDAVLFYQRYGCNSAEAKRLFTNLDAVLLGAR